MEHSRFLSSIREQCEALRTAARAAGPDAAVPTCPKWTVSQLVGHLGRVHSRVRKAVADPSGHEIEPAQWRERLAEALREAAAGADPELLDAAREVLRRADPEGSAAGKYTVDAREGKGVQIGDGNVQHNAFS
ncbi:hypothetical protein FNH05_33505 [Amycolatopsis rhizosphaerae]|uniref:Mycothiol-dependent maleylpyruvate isomerase metal-binding domain-containing protein n=1 Tax=Amycolatopsis rhizosphaerae TaxID=2053003 RepID=A0A558ADR4_9PSEU|nr:maleylpyruvate isomerase N-terminal domain-containing protein [Amycolatopsis rhizosphaerae]TVT22363.1 hypothetical protein FNH05_33505 [Amycolatopsis rhizosphaerae]